VGEALEVVHEVAALGVGDEPGRQLVGVEGRQALVIALARELRDRRGAQAAVQVIVQHNLGARSMMSLVSVAPTMGQRY